MVENKRLLWSQILQQRLKFEVAVFSVVLVLALIGVGITNFSASLSHIYWVIMTLILAIDSMISTWRFGAKKGYAPKQQFLIQLIHWGAGLVAILAVYTIFQTGQLSLESAGLMILLLLATVTFLNGIHLGWRFYLLGVLLFLTVLLAAYMEAFFWIILLVAIAMASFAVYWARYRGYPPSEEKTP